MRGEEFKLTLLWRPKPPRPPQYSQDEREEPKVGKRCDFFRALFDIQCVFSYSMHNLISIGRKGRRLGDSQSPHLPDRVTQQRPSTAREAANPNLRQIHNANTMQNTKDMF